MAPNRAAASGQGDGDVGDPIGQGDPQQGQGEAGSTQGSTSSRSTSPGGAGRRFSARSSSCRTSSHAAKRISSPRRTNTQASAGSARPAAPLQAHLPRGAQAPGDVGRIQPDKPDRYADPRGYALLILEGDAAARVERGDPVYDGCLRLDGHRAERAGADHRFLIETWLRSQYKEIDIRYIVHDAALKRSIRRRSTTTRERRHQDLLSL